MLRLPKYNNRPPIGDIGPIAAMDVDLSSLLTSIVSSSIHQELMIAEFVTRTPFFTRVLFDLFKLVSPNFFSFPDYPITSSIFLNASFGAIKNITMRLALGRCISLTRKGIHGSKNLSLRKSMEKPLLSSTCGKVTFTMGVCTR